jgi:Phage tail lysozyme
LRQAGTHTRKRKFHRVGRHAAPSTLGKAARRAGRVAPAVALAGALVTAPQVLHQATASTTALSSDVGAAHRTHGRTDAGPGGHVATATLHSHGAGRSQDDGGQPGTPQPKSQRAATTHGSGSPSAGKSPAPSKVAHRSRSANPSPPPSPSPSPTPSGPSCTGTTGLLPQNYAAIVTYLMAHGYTGVAAAGIAGNIYQESKGNPESVGSGGGGLIGFTPLPGGYVTGNVTADLLTQLAAIVNYNQQWAQYIPALNSAGSASEAAYIYMSDFERPGIPVAGTREAAATAVAAACHL